MKTTKLYKLLLLLPFFLSLPSLASDSLKVKKTEYYEDGKLVRATFFDIFGNNIKDFFYDFSDNFEGKLQNEAAITTYINNRKISLKSYYFKIDGNNVFFNNGIYIGNIQRAKYDSLGRILENNAEIMYFWDNYNKRICSLDSLEFLPIKYVDGFKIRIKYDQFGNKIEKRTIDKENKGKDTFYKYDSSKKLVEWIYINRPLKTIGKLSYFNNCTQKIEESYEGKWLKDVQLWKFCDNEKNQDFKTEKYVVQVKKRKPIGEPKLTFTQENIYENDRIVKIIYEDILLGKKKVHELKYEFY